MRNFNEYLGARVLGGVRELFRDLGQKGAFGNTRDPCREACRSLTTGLAHSFDRC